MIIDGYVVKDDFVIQEQEVFGRKVYSDGKYISFDRNNFIYSNAISRVCECGNTTEKHWTKCDECRSKIESDKWVKAVQREKIHNYVYSNRLGIFFEIDGDWSELEDKLICQPLDDIKNLAFKDLELYWCQDEYPQMVDVANLFEDVGYEDFDYQSDYSKIDEVEELVDKLNNVLGSQSVGYIVSNKRPTDEIIQSNENSFKELIQNIILMDLA